MVGSAGTLFLTPGLGSGAALSLRPMGFDPLCALVADHDVARAPEDVRRLLGVVFQAPALDPRLTVVENLRTHGHLYALRGDRLRTRVTETLTHVDLADRAEDRVDTLSGGLQRRVEIAKALMPEPRLLVLDEPSTGLDPGARRLVHLAA